MSAYSRTCNVDKN